MNPFKAGCLGYQVVYIRFVPQPRFQSTPGWPFWITHLKWARWSIPTAHSSPTPAPLAENTALKKTTCNTILAYFGFPIPHPAPTPKKKKQVTVTLTKRRLSWFNNNITKICVSKTWPFWLTPNSWLSPEAFVPVLDAALRTSIKSWVRTKATRIGDSHENPTPNGSEHRNHHIFRKTPHKYIFKGYLKQILDMTQVIQLKWWRVWNWRKKRCELGNMLQQYFNRKKVCASWRVGSWRGICAGSIFNVHFGWQVWDGQIY